MVSRNHISQTWVDDYLDLYNYAKQIGDVKWQCELLQKLTDKETFIQEERRNLLEKELWREYDIINEKLLALHQELKLKSGVRFSDDSMREMWELKLQRI